MTTAAGAHSVLEMEQKGQGRSSMKTCHNAFDLCEPASWGELRRVLRRHGLIQLSGLAATCAVPPDFVALAFTEEPENEGSGLLYQLHTLEPAGEGAASVAQPVE